MKTVSVKQAPTVDHTNAYEVKIEQFGIIDTYTVRTGHTQEAVP